jgi:4-hydroxybenzoate polyprenyltransferase
MEKYVHVFPLQRVEADHEPQPNSAGQLSSVASFLKTLYLFPCNDIPTMITPVTFLGVSGALSGRFYPADTTEAFASIISRIPKTFLWVWLNVLLFSISNQRNEESILEDSINKPWRPLPSGRISASQARRLLLMGVPALILICTFYVGAPEETILCLLLTWMYNDLGGANEHFLVRNGINSMAYFAYGLGALRVAGNVGVDAIQAGAFQWLGIISGIILTTMQVQDLKDQEGDRAINRSTAPLYLGDGVSRWTVAVGVLVWSFVSPWYWCLGVDGFAKAPVFAIPILLGSMVAGRVLLWRDPKADELTYKGWSIWLMSIFFSPVLARASQGLSF